MWQNQRCEKTQKPKILKLKNKKMWQTTELKMWQHYLKKKLEMWQKLKNTKGGKTRKLKMWQNSKTQNVMN